MCCFTAHANMLTPTQQDNKIKGCVEVAWPVELLGGGGGFAPWKRPMMRWEAARRHRRAHAGGRALQSSRLGTQAEQDGRMAVTCCSCWCCCCWWWMAAAGVASGCGDFGGGSALREEPGEVSIIAAIGGRQSRSTCCCSTATTVLWSSLVLPDSMGCVGFCG